MDNDNQISVASDQLIQDGYTSYSKFIMEGRALPSLIDGLKNVERRLLWVMLHYPKSKIEKSSAIEGDTLKYHPHGSCLVGSTRLLVANGQGGFEFKCISDLHNHKLEDGEFEPLGSASIDQETHRISPGVITDIWITKYTDNLIRIKLSNGAVLELTDDHPVMLDDYSFIRADEITTDHRLLRVVMDVSFEASHSLEVIEVDQVTLDNPVPVYDFTEIVNHNALFFGDDVSKLDGDDDPKDLDLVCLHNCYGSLVKMAQVDPSFIVTQGNFGSRDYGASAHRYTSAGLSKLAYLNYEFADYADMKAGELDGYEEPVSLPCLIPFAFLAATEGLGSGIASSVPKLDPISMIDSILEYLKDGVIKNYPIIDLGGRVVLTSSQDDVDNLLLSGRGSIRYHGAIEIDEDDGSFVLPYRPDRVNLGKVIDKAQSIGLDYVNLGEVHKFFRTKASRSLKDEDIINVLVKATSATNSFNLSLYKDTTGYKTNLVHQIHEMVNYLRQCIIRFFESSKASLESKLGVILASKSILDSGLLNHITELTDSQITEYLSKHCKDYNDHPEYYDKALSRSIRSLSRVSLDQVDELKAQIEHYKLLATDRSEQDQFIIDKYLALRDYLSEVYTNKTIYKGDN